MERNIAYCGLDCSRCDAYLATAAGDRALLEKTAKLWSELNGVTILPDDVRCEGCIGTGVKSTYCDRFCGIRKCASEKGVRTCGDCPEMEGCPTLGAITSNNPDALENLRNAAGE